MLNNIVPSNDILRLAKRSLGMGFIFLFLFHRINASKKYFSFFQTTNFFVGDPKKNKKRSKSKMQSTSEAFSECYYECDESPNDNKLEDVNSPHDIPISTSTSFTDPSSFSAVQHHPVKEIIRRFSGGTLVETQEQVRVRCRKEALAAYTANQEAKEKNSAFIRPVVMLESELSQKAISIRKEQLVLAAQVKAMHGSFSGILSKVDQMHLNVALERQRVLEVEAEGLRQRAAGLEHAEEVMSGNEKVNGSVKKMTLHFEQLSPKEKKRMEEMPEEEEEEEQGQGDMNQVVDMKNDDTKECDDDKGEFFEVYMTRVVTCPYKEDELIAGVEMTTPVKGSLTKVVDKKDVSKVYRGLTPCPEEETTNVWWKCCFVKSA